MKTTANLGQSGKLKSLPQLTVTSRTGINNETATFLHVSLIQNLININNKGAGYATTPPRSRNRKVINDDHQPKSATAFVCSFFKLYLKKNTTAQPLWPARINKAHQIPLWCGSPLRSSGTSLSTTNAKIRSRSESFPLSSPRYFATGEEVRWLSAVAACCLLLGPNTEDHPGPSSGLTSRAPPPPRCGRLQVRELLAALCFLGRPPAHSSSSLCYTGTFQSLL